MAASFYYSKNKPVLKNYTRNKTNLKTEQSCLSRTRKLSMKLFHIKLNKCHIPVKLMFTNNFDIHTKINYDSKYLWVLFFKK